MLFPRILQQFNALGLKSCVNSKCTYYRSLNGLNPLFGDALEQCGLFTAIYLKPGIVFGVILVFIARLKFMTKDIA